MAARRRRGERRDHRRTWLGALLAVSILAGAATSSPAEAGQDDDGDEGASSSRIIAHITELKNTKGNVYCALYTRDSWLERSGAQAEDRGAWHEPERGDATCRFEDVPPGTYGVAAFHDENGNDDLDTKIFGIPEEGVCTSNNVVPRFGPPDWEDAKFTHEGGVRRMTLEMLY